MIRRISKIIRNVTELVLYSVTVIAAAALMCAYLALAVDPASNTFFIPFGLAAPFIIGLNLLLALFWIIRWKPIAFLPVLLLAIGYGVVSRHIQLPVLKQYEKRTSADIDVTTYNVHIFRDADWNGSIDSIAKYIKTTDPDILAIQEYYASSSMPADTIGTIMGGYPYFKTFYIRSEPGSGVGYGLALYSRHKILRSEEIVFENESNGAMYADMIIEGDTVRVFNCHMQTTDVNNNDIALVEDRDESRTETHYGQTPEQRHKTGRAGRHSGRLRAIVALSGDTLRRLQRRTRLIHLQKTVSRSQRRLQSGRTGICAFVQRIAQPFQRRLRFLHPHVIRMHTL